jgi:protocatechuate 3,4-dioxygenase, beta subunit
MEHFSPRFSRRSFLTQVAVGAVASTPLRVFAEEWARFVEDGSYADELVRTPSQTEGPFYPDRLPLDRDNDLVLITGRTTPADGEVTHLAGRLLDLKGEPIRGAVIEIWQVDARGAYLHRGTENASRRDPNFQGFGQFETDAQGRYRFRTIKPVAYPGRTPHIHVKVKRGSRELLTTQLYIKGEPRNDRDGLLRSIRDPRARESLLAEFKPLKGSKTKEFEAMWNIVLGLTPEE